MVEEGIIFFFKTDDSFCTNTEGVSFISAYLRQQLKFIGILNKRFPPSPVVDGVVGAVAAA